MSHALVTLWAPVLRYLEGKVVPPLQERFEHGVGEVLDAVDVLAETAALTELAQLRGCISSALDAAHACCGPTSPELAAVCAGLSGQPGAQPLPVRVGAGTGAAVEVRFPGRGHAIPRTEHWAVVAVGVGQHHSVQRTGGTSKGVVATVHLTPG